MIKFHNPFRRDLPNKVVRDWLSQFEFDDQPYILPLLSHFRYYNSRRVFELLSVLHRELTQTQRIDLRHTLFVPFGYVAKSGSAVAYFYRRQNRLDQRRFVTSDDLRTIPLDDISTVVVLDDFIGSGQDAVNLWDELIYSLQQRSPQCQFVFACLVGYEAGISYAELHTQLTIIVAERIPPSEQPFIEDSIVYGNAAERDRAREAVEKYGMRIAPKEPLGYANTQALVGFFFSTPNNTLPIFWSTEENWKPLLPHGESLRDPALLMGPPRGLLEETITRHPRRWAVELDALDEYDIEPDMAVRILNEFQKTSVVLVLGPIIRDLGISHSMFGHLTNLIHHLEHAVHEKESVCAALMIPAADAISELHDAVFLAAGPNVTISDESEVEALAHLVYGLDGTVMIQPDGKVVGNMLYGEAESSSDLLLPRRYWPAAAASKAGAALLILFLGQGRVLIFYEGKRVLSQRLATWHIHSSEIDNVLRKIRSDHGISSSVMIEVLRIAFDLADRGSGTLFAVGDHEGVMAFADFPPENHEISRILNVRSLDKRAILGLIRQDGATLVAASGDIVRSSAYLRPPVGVSSIEEKGRGTKHHTAAKMSALTNAVMVAVSVDGRVSLYSRGQLLFKMMG